MNSNRIQAILCLTIASSITAIVTVPGTAFLAPPTIWMAADEWHFVAALSSVPADGVPGAYEVFRADRDVWVTNREQLLGRVFLIRKPGSTEVRGFYTLSRRGSSIRFDEVANRFEQTCWKVLFDLDGEPLPGPDNTIDDMIS